MRYCTSNSTLIFQPQTSLQFAPIFEIFRELHTVQSARWLQLRLQPGPRPAPREHFSLNYLANGWVVMFGGLNHSGSQYFNDLWLMDIKTDPAGPRWHQLAVGSEKPHPRAYHYAGVVHGRYLIIHGGLFPQGYRVRVCVSVSSLSLFLFSLKRSSFASQTLTHSFYPFLCPSFFPSSFRN